MIRQPTTKERERYVNMTVVTDKERMDTAHFWQTHLRALGKKQLASPLALSIAAFAQKPENVGYEGPMESQIRPGKLGQWDMYDVYLAEHTLEEERLLISGLTAEEVAAANRRIFLNDSGIDSDDPAQVAAAARLDAMTPAQVKEEIARLERLLNLEQIV